MMRRRRIGKGGRDGSQGGQHVFGQIHPREVPDDMQELGDLSVSAVGCEGERDGKDAPHLQPGLVGRKQTNV